MAHETFSSRLSSASVQRAYPHQLDSAVKLFVAAISYVMALAVVLSTNSLIGLSGGRQNILLMTVCVSLFALVILFWTQTSIRRTSLCRWIGWTLLLMMVYASVSLYSGSFGGLPTLFGFSILALTPLAVILGRSIGALYIPARATVNLCLLLAASSLILWLLGPTLGLISTNCSIVSTWEGLGTPVTRYGYYNLLYIVQSNSNLFGTGVVRNTGIFAEAPMYSLLLCICMLLECYCTRNPRRLVVIVLAITIVTTMCTTGYIFLLGMLFIWMAEKFHRSSRRSKVLLSMLFIFIAIIVFYACYCLVAAKLDTSSGLTRLDDFEAGYKAWMHGSILLGNGFGQGDLAVSYMSAFRSNNTGFSNSLMNVLVRGGIAYLFVFITATIGLFRISTRAWFPSCLFIFLWVFTISTNLPIMLLIFGTGAGSLCSGNAAAITQPFASQANKMVAKNAEVSI